MRAGVFLCVHAIALFSAAGCRQGVSTQSMHETIAQKSAGAVILEPVFSPNDNLMGVTLTNNSSSRFAIAVHHYSIASSSSPNVMYPFVYEDSDIESEVEVIGPGKSTFLAVSFDTDSQERTVTTSDSFELTFTDLRKVLKESKIQSQYVVTTIGMIESGRYATGQLTLKFTSSQK